MSVTIIRKPSKPHFFGLSGQSLAAFKVFRPGLGVYAIKDGEIYGIITFKFHCTGKEVCLISSAQTIPGPYISNSHRTFALNQNRMHARSCRPIYIIYIYIWTHVHACMRVKYQLYINVHASHAYSSINTNLYINRMSSLSRGLESSL